MWPGPCCISRPRAGCALAGFGGRMAETKKGVPVTQVRLTAAQALVRYLAAQKVVAGGRAGGWAEDRAGDKDGRPPGSGTGDRPSIQPSWGAIEEAGWTPRTERGNLCESIVGRGLCSHWAAIAAKTWFPTGRGPAPSSRPIVRRGSRKKRSRDQILAASVSGIGGGLVKLA